MITLLPGRYELKDAIKLDGRDSGNAGAPVIYRGSTVDIVYSPASLREIFINNVRRETLRNLVDPGRLKSDPLAAFSPTLVGGVAACKMKKVDLAKRYAAKLQGARKTQLKQTCQQEGVDL